MVAASASPTVDLLVRAFEDGAEVMAGLGAAEAAGVLYARDLLRFFFEHCDELAADDPALLLGVAHAGERTEKPLTCIDVHEIQMQHLAERLDDLGGLILAQ